MTDIMVKTTNRGTMFIVNGATDLNLQAVVDAFLKENNVEKMNELDFQQACDLNTKIRNAVVATKPIVLHEHKQETREEHEAMFEIMQNSGPLD
jgi:hypothetical protein